MGDLNNFLENEKVDLTPWTIKYKPKKIDQIIGQNKQIKQVLSFVDNFKKEKKKALIIYGPSGTGKSIIAEVIANERKFEFIEFNASDQRNKLIIEDLLGNVLKQQSLFGKSKLILLDDLDGISGSKDRGGVLALSKLIENSPFPIIITCQDPFLEKLKSIRNKCSLIELKLVEKSDISQYLKNIYNLENVEFKEEQIDIIVENSNGDLRAAIGDAQMVSFNNKNIDSNLLEELSRRLQNIDMKYAVEIILNQNDANKALNAFDMVSGDVFANGLLWLDYNMVKVYTNKLDRAKAYGFLTKSDVFKSRIMRRQNWRLLVYVNYLMTVGVCTSKENLYPKNIEYKASSRILKLWQAKMKYGRRSAISEKIANHIHCSTKSVIKDFHFYAQILSNDVENQLELDKEDLKYLKNIIS